MTSVIFGHLVGISHQATSHQGNDAAEAAAAAFHRRGGKGCAHCKKKSNHIRVHANLIEGFWELTLALPGDNPWRNDDL